MADLNFLSEIDGIYSLVISRVMFSILVKSILLFSLAQGLHILVWRIKRPTGYASWVPLMGLIFIGAGGLGAVWLATAVTIPGDDLVPPAWIEGLAIFLFHLVLSTVYIIGYTAISAFSPSMELIKTLGRTPEGLTRDQLATPFFQQGALSDGRIDNLIGAEMISEKDGYLFLARKGRPITYLILLYRRLIGLPDGGGG